MAAESTRREAPAEVAAGWEEEVVGLAASALAPTAAALGRAATVVAVRGWRVAEAAKSRTGVRAAAGVGATAAEATAVAATE